MTLAAQIFAVLAAFPAALTIIVLVRRGELRVKFALLWMPVVLAVIGVAVVPSALDRLADALGVGYPPTLAFVLANGLLVFVTVHLSWELSRVDERVRVLAERLALTGASESMSHQCCCRCDQSHETS